MADRRDQTSVAKGHYEEAHVQVLHQWMAAQLLRAGAAIDDWRYCPFHPNATNLADAALHPSRRPAPGMLNDLMTHWPVNCEHSLLVGDQTTDLAAAAHFDSGNIYHFLAPLAAMARQFNPGQLNNGASYA